jgi:hypothetical protein
LDQSIRIDADGNLGLSPAHALLLACMHRAGNAEHDPDRLIWLYDLYLLIKRMGVEEQMTFARLAQEACVQAVCLEGLAKSKKYFNTGLYSEAMMLLSEDSGKITGLASFKYSYLGLVFDDLKHLPSWHARYGLIHELLFPSAAELLRKYNKESSLWLPWLYARYISYGLLQRLRLN